MRFIKHFFTKGHERTLKAKKNILASIAIKGLNIAIGLALVPLTIEYLNPTKYGIWITLSSIIGWFGFFDIGLGNGLRNRFAEALAKGEHNLARTYVSTTYAILTLIIGGVIVLFFSVNPFINWGTILNTGEDLELNTELSVLALVVFTFFCLRFILKLITSVLQADQRPAMASLFYLIGNIIVLSLIFLLTKITQGSLLYLGIVMSSAPALVLLVSSIWFYAGSYSKYRPGYKFVDFSKAKDLLKLGAKFFIIQIAAVLLYQTNNIIITQLFGPSEVTPYNIAFRYFSVLTMGFYIILAPFWSAFTEAWVKKELDWIRKSMFRLFKLWGIVFLGGIIMVIVSTYVYKFWIGNEIIVPVTLSALVAVWAIVNTYNSIFSHFLNGIGRVKIQLFLGLSAAIVNIPLAIFLGKKLGVEGVLLSNFLVFIPSLIIYPIQYSKLMNSTAKGVWNK